MRVDTDTQCAEMRKRIARRKARHIRAGQLTRASIDAEERRRASAKKSKAKIKGFTDSELAAACEKAARQTQSIGLKAALIEASARFQVQGSSLMAEMDQRSLAKRKQAEQ